MTGFDQACGPSACTLPTADRPLRRAEFDALLAAGLRGQRRLSPTRLRWHLDPAIEATARELTTRESACCTFFSFVFTLEAGTLHLDIDVPPARTAVLDALADASLR